MKNQTMKKNTTKSLVGQPDQRPTVRDLNDFLASLYASGRFSHFATFRAPENKRPSNRDPQYDPAADIKLAEGIARQLARQGLSVAIAPAFRSISSENAPCRHFHAALTGPPSPDWIKAKTDKHGPRAVDIRELGNSPLDPARVAKYHAKQSVSITVAYRDSTDKVVVRSADLDDSCELFDDLENAGSPGPEQPAEEEIKTEVSAPGNGHPRGIPPEAREKLEEMGLLKPEPPEPEPLPEPSPPAPELPAPKPLPPIDLEKVDSLNNWARSLIEKEQQARAPPPPP